MLDGILVYRQKGFPLPRQAEIACNKNLRVYGLNSSTQKNGENYAVPKHRIKIKRNIFVSKMNRYTPEPFSQCACFHTDWSGQLSSLHIA